MEIDHNSCTIIGVMKPSFQFPTKDTQMWLLISADARWPKFQQFRFADAFTAVARLKALVRLLQTDLAATQARLDRAEQEAWDHKVKRADATARLKNRENLLEQIQRSAAWRAVKPLWKLFHRSRKSRLDAKEIAGDLAFALDLPKEWKTNREILLIKGWCFSRSGKAIAETTYLASSASSMLLLLHLFSY